MKHNETTYLGKFKWGRKQQTTIPENLHVHIFDLVMFCLNHILELLNRKSKCAMLIYAFSTPFTYKVYLKRSYGYLVMK